MDLSPEQRAVVEHLDGPMLVLAGAGAGKTGALVERIAGMVEQRDVDPSNVLGITFTTRAAREFRERLERRVGPAGARVATIRTFNSFCLLLCRTLAANRPYRHRRTGQELRYPNGKIYVADEPDRQRLVREALARLGRDPSGPGNAPAALLQQIERAQQSLLWPGAIVPRPLRPFLDLYEEYEACLVEEGLIDFGRMVSLAVEVLATHDDLRRGVEDQFRYLHVDEFQDCNYANYRLVHALASRSGNLCAVADPKQTIYEWRDADLRRLLQLRRDFGADPRWREVYLSRNHRSTATLVRVQNAFAEVIRDFERSDPEMRDLFAAWEMTPTRPPGPAAVLARAECLHGDRCDGADEPEWVWRRILRLERQEGRTALPIEHAAPSVTLALQRYAILARQAAHAARFARYFARLQVPYAFSSERGGRSFYRLPEIRFLRAMLRVLNEPDGHYKELASVLALVDRVWRAGGGSPGGLAHWAPRVRTGEDLDERDLARTPDGARFIAVFQALAGLAAPAGGDPDLPGLVDAILELTGYRDWLARTDPGAAERFASIARLKGDLAAQPSLGDALLDLDTAMEAEGRVARGNAIGVFTVHAAKGLEFPVVFVAGFGEGTLPGASRHELESVGLGHATPPIAVDPSKRRRVGEELRIAYTAVTRAADRLYLTYPERSRQSPLVDLVRRRLPRGYLVAA